MLPPYVPKSRKMIVNRKVISITWSLPSGSLFSAVEYWFVLLAEAERKGCYVQSLEMGFMPKVAALTMQIQEEQNKRYFAMIGEYVVWFK